MNPLPPLVGSGYYIGLCSKSALKEDPLPPPQRRRRLWMAPYGNQCSESNSAQSTASATGRAVEGSIWDPRPTLPNNKTAS